jgi:hypothetical protein
MALLESIQNPTLTIGAAYVPISIKIQTGQLDDVLRWSQNVIDLADGDAAKGANFAMGSPLAAALGFRGLARSSMGRPGWREDLEDALAMAQRSDPVTHALIAAVVYGFAIVSGVLQADDRAVREVEEALHTAEKSSDDTALESAKYMYGLVLIHRDPLPDRDRGLELLREVCEEWLRERTRLNLASSAAVVIARETARRGDPDGAIAVLRTAVHDLFNEGQLTACGLAIAILVETLLDRGAEGDVAEAEAGIDRFATLPVTEGWAVRDIWLMRLRALLCRARGEDVAYRDFVNRYRTMADSLGFERHIAMAEAM